MFSKTAFRFIVPFLLFMAMAVSAQSQPHSKLVVPATDGTLTYYPYTQQGDVIPDFSHCGYMGGGVALPDVRVAAVVIPSTLADDAPRIQQAIDSLASTLPAADGFRGTILLKKGLYRIGSPLRVHTSGVVLRGEGNCFEDGTVLLATSAHKYNVIEIGPDNKRARHIPVSEHHHITDGYVPSGRRAVHVADAGKHFRTGDKVIVHRPSTAGWISDIGMDSIPPRPLRGESTYDSFARLRSEGADAEMNGTVQWKPGSKDLYYERTVEAVDGDRLTFDIPIVNALQAEYGGATVYKYEFPERISHCGVENLCGMSVFDESVTADRKDIGTYCSDENHANVFVWCGAVENAWVRDVSVRQFDCCVSTTANTKFITGLDLLATEPVSVITGGRRYAYSVWGQMNLFVRCNADNHRHPYVLGASVAGPNAFVDGRGTMSFASSEPHQRWATGCLFDNIRISGPDGSLLAVDRGWYGSGHGWSGAQMVFWNCSAPVIMVMRPPTAQNFAIGSCGMVSDEWSEAAREGTIRAINGVSRSHFKYEGSASVGDGWIEHPAKTVAPESLYFNQLEQRLGKSAVQATAKK